MSNIRFLTVEEIIYIHFYQIEQFGGMHGILDISLLKASASSAYSGTKDTYLHPDIFHMAASYAYSIIKNHPFIDGNKRTGILAALLFLQYNEYEITLTQEQLFTLAMSIAKSKITLEEIASCFKDNS